MSAAATPARQHHNITLAVLATAALAYSVSQTMVVPALPEIQRDLGVSTGQVTWVITVYLLTAAIATPILGRFGDMFGKERLLVATLVAFGTGLTVAALADSLPQLVAGRAIQGVGGAVFPLAFGIIRDEFPRAKVATGIGLISGTFGIGGGAGLVISGPVVEGFGYESIFWLALVVVVGAIVMTRLFVPESPVRAPARIDWAGAALLSAGLVCVLLAVSKGNAWGWDSPGIAALLGAGVSLLAVWAWVETRVEAPMVDMRMLRRRGVWTSNVAALLIGFGMFGAFIITPQLVQAPEATGYGFGASVSQAGLFMLPSSAVMLVAAPLAGWLGTRVGSRVPVLLGTAAGVASFAWLALAHAEAWQIVLGVGLLGVGIGLSLAALANLIVEAVEPTRTGVATGMNTIMRMIGGSLGGQLAASVVGAHVVAGSVFPSESGYALAFAMLAAAFALAFGAALATPRARVRVRVRT